MSNTQEDLLNRTDFIKNHLGNLKTLLERGGCIGFTAPFGGGKSWLCDQFIEKIEKESLPDIKNIKTIKIDASLHQYVIDPLVPIWSALSQALPDDAKSRKLKKKFLGIIKFLISAASTSFLYADITSLIPSLRDDSSHAESIEKQIENYKKELSEYATTHPILFFIDELDRCTPEFTLKFLDHTRHYFTIPNIGFVLMLNDHQIYKHIKHVLGDDQGKIYLEKFIPTLIPLPTLEKKDAIEFYHKPLGAFYERKLSKGKSKDSFINMALFLSEARFQGNLRKDKQVIDIANRFQKEKAGDLYLLDYLDAYVMHLKVRDHTLFDMFMQGDIEELWNREKDLIDYFAEDSNTEWVHGILTALKDECLGLSDTHLISREKFRMPSPSAPIFIQNIRSSYSSLLTS